MLSSTLDAQLHLRLLYHCSHYVHVVVFCWDSGLQTHLLSLIGWRFLSVVFAMKGHYMYVVVT